MEVYDHLESRKWAIQLASDAAITVLKVDQVFFYSLIIKDYHCQASRRPQTQIWSRLGQRR